MAANQARRWCFTIFERSIQPETLEQWENWARINQWNGVRYLVFQRETSTTTQRQHVQGYIHFTGQKRMHNVQALLHAPNCHMEMSKGNPSDNRAYCTDPDKRVPGATPFEFGDCPGNQGSKLTQVASTIKQRGLKRAIEEYPGTFICHARGMRDLDRYYKRQKIEERVTRDVTVLCVWGEAGSGKSYFAEHFDIGNCYSIPDITKRERLNMDGYDGQRPLDRDWETRSSIFWRL